MRSGLCLSFGSGTALATKLASKLASAYHPAMKLKLSRRELATLRAEVRREICSEGGRARACALAPADRSRIARLGAAARWKETDEQVLTPAMLAGKLVPDRKQATGQSTKGRKHGNEEAGEVGKDRGSAPRVGRR